MALHTIDFYKKSFCSYRLGSLARSRGGWVGAEGGASSRGAGSRGGRGGSRAFVVATVVVVVVVVAVVVVVVSVPGGNSFVSC